MNSESRLSEPSPEPASPFYYGGDEGSEGRETGNGKGFFGRVLSVLTGSEQAQDDTDTNHICDGRPSLVNLRRMRVDDVALPKVEIVAAPVDIQLNDLVDMFREHGCTRIPVYRGSLDSPLGLIHLKDLALKHGFGQGGTFSLRSMLRPLLYVPPSMPIGILLQQMQQKRIHMALVIDEYGGVDGLVTIEDLIEQVVGEIEDEHDEVAGGLWVKEKPGQWLIQARAALDAVEAETGISLIEDEEVDTLGGLVFMLAGRVPAQGEVITHSSGTTFEVIEADQRRVKRIRLRLPAVADKATASHL